MRQGAQGALMSSEADVFAGFEKGVEEEAEGFAGLAGTMAGEGEQGDELGVVGELNAGGLDRAHGVVGASDAEQGDGVAEEGVGLLGGGGETEGEGALVGGEGRGVGALRSEGEGLLGGDFGHVRMAGVEVTQGGEHVVGFTPVTGADDGVESRFPFGHGGEPGQTRPG
jgi:hypothetical protein